jgi:hypothetical protein
MRVSMKMSETGIIDSLELKLERLEYGLAMPRDEDAIARTKALLEEAERAGWQALTGIENVPSPRTGGLPFCRPRKPPAR